MNAYALKRRATPQISSLQETKTKLQSINVFFDHRSLQIPSSNWYSASATSMGHCNCTAANAWKCGLGGSGH